MSASLYTHLPLTQPDKQIRLLRLEPSSPDHDNYIFSLAVHEFDENNCPPYIAISYTWGLPVGLLPIFVNGHKIKAHFNCWFALWQMRHHGYTGQNFWIDSLCINQGDDKEKSVQVAMMGEIFSSATWVASCIGTGDSIGCIRDILESGDSHVTGEMRGKIYRLPYFERVWIKQEIILAKDVKIFSGTDALSRTEFSRVSGMAEMREMGGSGSSDLSVPDFETEGTDNQRIRSQRPTKWRTFPDVAFHYRKAKATDPKDKIYALLPLLPKDDPVRQHLPIVYGKGTSLPLLHNLVRLFYGRYKAVIWPFKNFVLGLVADWLQSDLAEDAMSCRNLDNFFGCPRLGKDDEYADVEMYTLRMIHEEKPYNQGSKYSLRVAEKASTSLDTERDCRAYNFGNDDQFICKQSHGHLSSLTPPDLRAMKVVYNYFFDDKDPSSFRKIPGMRTAMFYVNADVRPGDVIVVLRWGEADTGDCIFLSKPLFKFPHAILRPIHVTDKHPRAKASSCVGDEGNSSHQPVYVFHSWAVPASDDLKLLCDDDPDRRLEIADFNRKSYPVPGIKSFRVRRGLFKLHYQEALRLLVMNNRPLHSLLHPSTEKSFGWSIGMSFVENKIDRDGKYLDISGVIEAEKEYTRKEEAGELGRFPGFF